jgi:type IV secretion system protein VirB8
MFNRKRSPLAASQQQLSQLSWEANIVDSERRSAKLAWKVTFAALLIGLLGSAAAVLVLPLKSTEVRVVTVDKLTGETALAGGLSTYVATPNDLNDKFWTKRFLMARERYSYKILQADYDVVRLLAANTPWRSYAAQFEGPDALEKKYGPDIEVIPTVLSTTISQYGIATLRYELKERDMRNLDAPAKIERRVATLRYHYAPAARASERELIENPLGFVVDAYQSVLEVANASPAAAVPDLQEMRPLAQPVPGKRLGAAPSPMGVKAVGQP